MKKNTILAFLLVAVAALSLGGCGGNDDPVDVSVLSGWQGEWKCESTYLESPEMQAAYEAVAKAYQEAKTAGGVVSAEDVHEAMKAMLQTSVTSVTVAGDSITFTDVKGESATSEYRYVKDIPMPGFDGHFWKAFEAIRADSPYRYVICTEVHQDDPENNSMKHWHFRTGMGMGFEALVNHPNVMWWPTLVAADTSVAVVAEDTTNGAADFAGFFKMLPSLSCKREGTWKSNAAFLNDPAMDEAYEAIAAQAEGYSALDAKAFIQKMTDPKGIVSITVEKGDRLTFVTSDGSEMKFSYTPHLFSPMPGWDGWSWYRFEASDAVSPYRYLIVSLVHQDDPANNSMLHWHARFGTEGVKSLVEYPGLWFPTFVSEDTKLEQVVKEMKAGAKEFAQMLKMFPKK